MPRVVPSIVVQSIETTYPWAKNAADGAGGSPALAQDQAPNIGMILELLDALPHELLPANATDYAMLVAALGAMRAALTTWQGGGHPGHASTLHPMEALGGDHPVTAVLKILRECPDEAAGEAVADFSFIEDEDARESLRIDASTAHRSLGNGEYKAATVLAGSVVEGLLLWAISQCDHSKRDAAAKQVSAVRKQSQRKPIPQLDPEHWHLADYIDVAAQLKLIGAETQKALELAAEYRNLIHPGRVLRSGMDCSQGTALSALGAMERLIEQID